MAVFLQPIIEQGLFDELTFDKENRCTNLFYIIIQLKNLADYSKELEDNIEGMYLMSEGHNYQRPIDLLIKEATSPGSFLYEIYKQPKYQDLLNNIGRKFWPLLRKYPNREYDHLIPKLDFIKQLMFNMPYNEKSLECFRKLRSGVDLDVLGDFFKSYPSIYSFKHINSNAKIFSELEYHMSEESYQKFFDGLLDVQFNDEHTLCSVIVRCLRKYEHVNVDLLRRLVNTIQDKSIMVMMIEHNHPRPVPQNRCALYEIVEECLESEILKKRIQNIIKYDKVKYIAGHILTLVIYAMTNNIPSIISDLFKLGLLKPNDRLPGTGNPLDVVAVLYKRLNILCEIVSHPEHKSGARNNNGKGIMHAIGRNDFVVPDGAEILNGELDAHIVRICNDF